MSVVSDFQAYIASVTFVASLALVILGLVLRALILRVTLPRERDM